MNHQYSIKRSFCIFVFFITFVSVLKIIILPLFLKNTLLFVLCLENVFCFVLLVFPCIYLIILLHNFRQRFTWVRNEPFPWLVSGRKLFIEIQARIGHIPHLFGVPILLLLLWIIVSIVNLIICVISFVFIHPLLGLLLLLSLPLFGIL